jgi:hypothetical protein
MTEIENPSNPLERIAERFPDMTTGEFAAAADMFVRLRRAALVERLNNPEGLNGQFKTLADVNKLSVDLAQ